MRWFLTLATLLVSGCDQVFELTGRLPPDAPGPPADAVDAPDAPFDPATPFGSATAVILGCPSTRTSGDVTLDRAETLFLYTCTNMAGTDSDIYEAPLLTVTTADVGTAVLATASIEGSPELSPDGLDLFYLTFPVAGNGQIERRQRPSIGMPFVPVSPGGGLNSSSDDRPGSPDSNMRIVITRTNQLVELRNTGTWTVVMTTSALAPPGVSVFANPHMSADGLILVFAAGTPNKDLYIARRAHIDDAWEPPMPITELNTTGNETDPWLSADGRRIYFSRNTFVLVAQK